MLHNCVFVYSVSFVHRNHTSCPNDPSRLLHITSPPLPSSRLYLLPLLEVLDGISGRQNLPFPGVIRLVNHIREMVVCGRLNQISRIFSALGAMTVYVLDRFWIGIG